MNYVNNLYVKSVLGVGFLPYDDEPIREAYQPKKRQKDQSCPLHPPPPPKTN